MHSAALCGRLYATPRRSCCAVSGCAGLAPHWNERACAPASAVDALPLLPLEVVVDILARLPVEQRLLAALVCLRGGALPACGHLPGPSRTSLVNHLWRWRPSWSSVLLSWMSGENAHVHAATPLETITPRCRRKFTLFDTPLRAASALEAVVGGRAWARSLLITAACPRAGCGRLKELDPVSYQPLLGGGGGVGMALFRATPRRPCLGTPASAWTA